MKVDNIDFNTIYKVLSSSDISHSQKIDFVRQNKSKIENAMEQTFSSSDFKIMMKNRQLIKFRPLKNSFTKRGDKKLLAMALNVSVENVDEEVDKVVTQMMINNPQTPVDFETIDKVKTYVYRHGKKEQILNCLDYELTHAKDKLRILYSTLEYNTGGVADYFLRPIHRLDNITLTKLYNVIDKNLKDGISSGTIPENKSQEAAQWALVQIFRIQNNQRLRNAIKFYKENA